MEIYGSAHIGKTQWSSHFAVRAQLPVEEDGTVVSSDADTLHFGSPHVGRAMRLTQGRVESTTLASLFIETTLTLSHLRGLAVLSGCDRR